MHRIQSGGWPYQKGLVEALCAALKIAATGVSML